MNNFDTILTELKQTKEVDFFVTYSTQRDPSGLSGSPSKQDLAYLKKWIDGQPGMVGQEMKRNGMDGQGWIISMTKEISNNSLHKRMEKSFMDTASSFGVHQIK